MLFKAAQQHQLAGTTPPVQLAELTAGVERTLAWAHTGNTKVISTRVMSFMHTRYSLPRDGMPSFSPGILFTGNPKIPLHVDLEKWPCNSGPNKSLPEITSKRAQILTYGTAHYAVSAISSLAGSFSDDAATRAAPSS